MAKQKKIKVGWKKLLLGIVLLIFIVIVLLKFAELQQIALLLKKVRYEWLFCAMSAQFAVFVFLAYVYKILLSEKSKAVPFWYLIKTTAAMVFIDHTLPSFSASGNVLLFYAARKKQIKKGRASLAIALNIFLNFVLYFIILVAGFAFLLLSKGTISWLWLPIVLMLAAFVLLARILWTASGQRHFSAVMSWLLQKRPHARRRTLKLLSKLYLAKKEIKKKVFVIALITIALSYLFKITTIGAVFLAVGNIVSLGVLIIGYFIATFISTLSWIRVGVYEGAMAGAYAGLGIEYNLALTATLLYRAVAFWLPMLIGFFCFKNLMKNKNG